MGELQAYAGEIFRRIENSFQQEKGSNMLDSLRGVLMELKGYAREKPVEALGVGFTLGFVATRFLKSEPRSLSKALGKGIGSMLALRFLESISQNAPQSKEHGLSH